MIIEWQVKIARELLGWSQYRLVERLGVCRKLVARWENGRNIPNVVDDARLRGALSSAAVFFGEGSGGGPRVRLREANDHSRRM